MRIGIIVSTESTAKRKATTYSLAAECAAAGHEVWITSPHGLSFGPDGRVRARARRMPEGDPATDRYWKRQVRKTEREVAIFDDLDLLLIRNNPPAQRHWARHASLLFGQLAAARGVLVLNDPYGLARATTKLYLESFPEHVRPRTLVSRDPERIEAFLDEEKTIVLKPLQGFGGTNVFLVSADDRRNLDQIVHAVSRDGYVVAQSYLPEAAEGDLRVYLLDGVLLEADGRVAAVRRVPTGDSIRSNVHAGGVAVPGEVDDAVRALAAAVRPRLREDGMFLVGLDVVGDKVMEINVFSPGGLRDAADFHGVDYIRALREALERKVESLPPAPGRMRRQRGG